MPGEVSGALVIMLLQPSVWSVSTCVQDAGGDPGLDQSLLRSR